MSSEKDLEVFKDMREALLESQVRLEMAAKAINQEVISVSGKITVIRTELLSLINIEKRREDGFSTDY